MVFPDYDLEPATAPRALLAALGIEVLRNAAFRPGGEEVRDGCKGKCGRESPGARCVVAQARDPPKTLARSLSSSSHDLRSASGLYASASMPAFPASGLVKLCFAPG